MITRTVAASLVLALAVTGCSGSESAGARREASSTRSAGDQPVPGVTLPADPLRALVPAPDDVPAGMVPLVAGSGSRDVRAVAEFSADPVAAQQSLTEHGFRSAYAAQYAHPSDGRVLSVVVVRFADAAGAEADYVGDVAGSSGDVIEVPTIGSASQVLRQPLPGDSDGELVTLRFRQGATTWLLAYGARPTADPQVAVELARPLVERAED